jgi:hypothetical protein
MVLELKNHFVTSIVKIASRKNHVWIPSFDERQCIHMVLNVVHIECLFDVVRKNRKTFKYTVKKLRNSFMR